jgi:hypothetical protein
MPSANKQVLVTFAPKQWKLVTPFVGTVGIGQADTIRNIVIHWILEHSQRSEPASEDSSTAVADKGGQ